MSNDLVPTPPPEDDDGFHRSPSDRAGGTILKWTDAQGWLDYDGLKPPSPLLVWKIDTFYRSWKDNRPIDIVDKPLPDLDELNSAIPQSEWKTVDGKQEPPWKHYVGVYFIDPATGKAYKWEHCTAGAHKAFDELREAVINTRLLRGTKCMPLVNLTERPWQVKTGLRKRPYLLDNVSWKTPGGDRAAIPVKPPTPQLTGPNAAPVETPTPAPTTPTTASPPTAPANNPTPPQSAKPKPPVNLAAETLGTMGEVKPVTTAEIMDDEIPY